MATPTSRTRLNLTQLDDRTVPSTVTVSSTTRPLDFVGTGTLTTSDPSTDNGVAVTTTTTTAVNLAGAFNYTGNASGQTGTVTLTGTGTGTETPTAANTTGGIGAFAETTQAQLALQDNNGTISTPTPLSGTTNWLTPGGTSGTDPLGPQTATGTFDVSDFDLQAGWGTTGSSTGTLTATLAPADPQPTALAFGTKSATLAADGSVSLNFGVQVTGNLMTAASHTTAVTTVTATWQGNGQTQATDLSVPIYWNTGQLTILATGLTPPAWATSLTVQIDPQHVVTQSSATTTTWTIALSSLTPVTTPPDGSAPGTGGTTTGTSPPATGTSPPATGTTTSPPATPPVSPPPVSPPPVSPPPVVASYVLIASPSPVIEWLDAQGTILADTPAFPGFNGPVSIATADVNGDGIPDLIIAAGVGGGPRVRVVDGKTGADIADFFAYAPTFRGGVSVAVGDLTGDGGVEIITGAGAGGGPAVGIFNALTGQLINQFYAYAPSFTGGVNVAAGDLTGSGTADIITGTGAGGSPLVEVFDATGNQLFSTYAAASTARNGVQVAAGDDTTDNAVVVTADLGPGTPLARFRSQLAAGGPLLVQLTSGAIPVGQTVSVDVPPPTPVS